MSVPEIDPKSAPWLLGYAGAQPSDGFLRLLEKHPPAALILFRDNLPRSKASLPPLRARLEEATGRALPLFLDEEGGWIQITGVRPAWPSPRAQALAGPDTVQLIHQAMAAQAAEMGVEAFCAPLADLDGGGANPVIGSRSFGEDPQEVSLCVKYALRGLEAGGVVPMLKHFPGHGDSEEDSHLTLPRVGKDRLPFLDPFLKGILLDVPAIMSAHLALGGDPRPATLRRDIMTGLLREELGFRGLAVSDALEMKALAGLPLAERGAAALEAGCDLLTLGRWEPGLEVMIEGLAERGDPAERERAWQRWGEYLERLEQRPGPGPVSPARLESALTALREGAILHPKGGPLDGYGVERMALEFGPTGSRRRDDYLHDLARFPLRILSPEDRIKRGEAYLYIGRTPPSRERQDEIRTRYLVTRPPVLLVAGPLDWCSRFRHCLATVDPSPPGVLALVERARRGQAPEA